MQVLYLTSASTSSLVNPVQELITDTPGTYLLYDTKTEADWASQLMRCLGKLF